VREVYQLAERTDRRFRALGLVDAMGSMRWGELAGLQRRHVVLVNGVIKFRQGVVELSSGELRISPPKTNAGRRTVYLPEVVLQDLRIHFAIFVKSEPDAFVFTGAKGAQLRRSTFQGTGAGAGGF
jgi:integrase